MTGSMRPRVQTLLSVCVIGGAVALGVVGGLLFKPAAMAQAQQSQEEKKTDDKAQSDDQAEETDPKGEQKFKHEHPFSRRVDAPGFEGGTDWLNTAGPLELKDLRGKFVILDFWTYCCINCMHILPELKKLEHAYPNNVVVIGVHSAKFDTEKNTDNIREAILRHEIEHPVVNDEDMKIWRAFVCRSWPSLRVIDPQGQLVAGHSGEITFEALDGFLKKAMPYYRERGLLNEEPLQFDIERLAARKDSPLYFPGKVMADEKSNRLFISDSNHNRLVITDLAGKLQEIIGSGEIGKQDGSYKECSFNKPQGVALDGDTLYVADTENHLIRKIDLVDKQVTTIAGTGKQRRDQMWPGVVEGTLLPPERWVDDPKTTAINSPWALYVQKDKLYIAMAGPHQIWMMTIDEEEIGPYAGNGREDIVDGPLLPRQPYQKGFSSFAQPSGLASDGEWLYVADSEGSSIRAVPFDPEAKVRTVIGTNDLPQARLFTFGDVDGPKEKALLQHPIGVAYHDQQLFVTDTYNNKIKVIDAKTGNTQTLAGTGEPGLADKPAQFDEPAGISYANGKLYVADTNNHAIRVIDLESKAVSTLEVAGLSAPKAAEAPVNKPLTTVKAQKVEPLTLKSKDGKVQLEVTFNLPFGYKMNPLAPLRYKIEKLTSDGQVASAKITEVVKVSKPNTTISIPVPTTAESGEDRIRLSLVYYYCQSDSAGICKTDSVAWEIPLRWSADAETAVGELKHSAE